MSHTDQTRHAVAAFCCNAFDSQHVWDDEQIDEDTIQHWIDVADAILATIQQAQTDGDTE